MNIDEASALPRQTRTTVRHLMILPLTSGLAITPTLLAEWN